MQEKTFATKGRQMITNVETAVSAQILSVLHTEDYIVHAGNKTFYLRKALDKWDHWCIEDSKGNVLDHAPLGEALIWCLG